MMHTDQLVEGILSERYQMIYALLEEEKEYLEKLANTLLQDETIDIQRMTHLLGERPADKWESIPALHEDQTNYRTSNLPNMNK